MYIYIYVVYNMHTDRYVMSIVLHVYA